MKTGFKAASYGRGPRCGPLKNAHVLACTLRFFSGPTPCPQPYATALKPVLEALNIGLIQTNFINYIITKGSTGIESFLLSPKKTEPIGGGSYASLPPEKDSGSSTCGRDQREGGRLEVGAATVPTLGRQPRWAALLESASGGRWRAGRRDCDISKILF